MFKGYLKPFDQGFLFFAFLQLDIHSTFYRVATEVKLFNWFVSPVLLPVKIYILFLNEIYTYLKYL